MPRVVLAPRVRRWLHAELAYLAELSPAAVRRLRERIGTARQLLSEHPRIGALAVMPGTRRLVVTPYVVIYRQRGTDVEVLDIRHSRQTERPLPEQG